MAKLYFGFGISDAMFTTDVELTRKAIKDVGLVNHILNNPNHVWCEEMVPCLNPSHKATIDAMVTKFRIEGISIPEIAPRVQLEPGDKLLVMSPRGLPRLQDRHEYTDEEIENATFSFALYAVEEIVPRAW